MLEVIEINGANLTGDVTLTAATTGGGSIFDLTGYRPSITLSPTAGAISSNVTVIAATGFSDKATYNGTITVHSEVSDFVDKTINLSITITPTYEVAIAVNDANMGSATLNGGTAAIYAASEDELTLVATPKSGYEFVNWTLSSDNLLIDDEDAASTTANTIVGDETITANFRLKPTFTWIVNGEETTETANTGATLTQKPTPTATLGGKAFVGWTTTPIVGEAVSSTYIANTPATMPEGGATYYAVYAKVDQEAAVYKDTIDMTESVTGWSTTNTDEYFSQPYGMKSVNKYTLNKSISNFSSYANSAESITIGVKCLQNNGTTSRLTISLVDEDGNVIDGTGKVVTPVNATSASNTTYQTVNYSASEVQDKDATGYKIQCTTYGKNVLVNGTAYIINVPASLSAYATNQYAVTFNATPSDGTVAIKNGETPISSGDKFWSGTKLDVTATPTTAGYKLITLTANGTDIKDAKYFTIAAADVEVVATFEDATALDNLESEGKAVKVLIDGQIFILRDGKTYTIQGQLVK